MTKPIIVGVIVSMFPLLRGAVPEVDKPLTWFQATPSDILPMSVGQDYVLLHNVLITGERTLQSETVSGEQLPGFFSESLSILDDDGVLDIISESQTLQAGFQYFTKRLNWYAFFNHSTSSKTVTGDNGALQIQEAWSFSTEGLRVGSAFSFYRSRFMGSINGVIGSGILYNQVQSRAGIGTSGQYSNQYVFSPLSLSLNAEWTSLRWLTLALWIKGYMPLLLGELNDIDRQFSSLDSGWSFGLDIRGRVDVFGLGIQTSLTSMVREWLGDVSLQYSTETEEVNRNKSPIVFNLSVWVPIEIFKR